MKEILRKTLKQASPKYIWNFIKACNTKQRIAYIVTTILVFLTGATVILPIIIWLLQIYLLVKFDNGDGAFEKYDEEKEEFVC